MSTGTDIAEVRRALHLAAEGLTPPADLAIRARQGGRRRSRRRRLLATSGVLALVLVAVGVTTIRPTEPSWQSPLSLQLMEQPTSGDLADDQAYLDRVRAADRRTSGETLFGPSGIPGRLLGEPRVAWAGETPVGPAAVVVQWLDLPGRPDPPQTNAEGRSGRPDHGVWIRFFGTGTDGAPERVGEDVIGWFRDSSAFLVGPDRSVLVVLSAGDGVEFSLDRVYTSDNVTRTDWRPLVFGDGAAVQVVPPQRDHYTVAVRSADETEVNIGNLTDPEVLHSRAGGLDWHIPASAQVPGDTPSRFSLGGPGEPPSPDVYQGLCSPSNLADPSPHLVAYGLVWYAFGRTQTGEIIVACDLRLGADPMHTLVAIQHRSGETTLLYGPAVEPEAPLPVAVELPDRQGWLVARKDATLDYRIGDGDWQPAGRDAALLPATATAVRVDRTEVPLR